MNDFIWYSYLLAYQIVFDEISGKYKGRRGHLLKTFQFCLKSIKISFINNVSEQCQITQNPPTFADESQEIENCATPMNHIECHFFVCLPLQPCHCKVWNDYRPWDSEQWRYLDTAGDKLLELPTQNIKQCKAVNIVHRLFQA